MAVYSRSNLIGVKYIHLSLTDWITDSLTYPRPITYLTHRLRGIFFTPIFFIKKIPKNNTKNPDITTCTCCLFSGWDIVQTINVNVIPIIFCNIAVCCILFQCEILYSKLTSCLSIDLPQQGSTLEKKPWGQLAPKFIDLVASTNFLVAKKFSALQAKDFYSKISFDTVKLCFLLSLLLLCFSHITLICLDFFSSKEKET